MAIDTVADRLALNAVPSGAMLLDGDLGALDPTGPAVADGTGLPVQAATDGVTDLTDDPVLSPQASPVVSGLNGTVLDFHGAIEGSGDQTGTIGATHGLTNLGETFGLGRIGGDNLVTHALYAPSDIAAGNVSDLTAVPGNSADVASAGVGLANGALSDVQTADTGGLQSTLASVEGDGGAAAIAPITGSPLLDPTANPLTTAANASVLDFHASIEGTGDAMGVAGTTHGLTNLGETVGMGKIGGDNTLTHVLDAPSDVLAGNTGDVTALPGNAAQVGTAAVGLVNGVASDGAGLLDNGVVGQVANGVVDGGTQAVGSALDSAGLHSTGDALAGLGNPGSGIIGDVQHLAGDTLGTVPTVTAAATALATGAGSDVSTLAGTVPTPTTLLGTGNTPGAHDLADASVGPSGNGGTINVLGTPVTDSHTLDVHALAVPAAAPAGVAVAALGDGGALQFGSTGGGGGDALSGALQSTAASVTHVAAPEVAAPATDAAMPIDLHSVAGLDHLTSHHL